MPKISRVFTVCSFLCAAQRLCVLGGRKFLKDFVTAEGTESTEERI